MIRICILVEGKTELMFFEKHFFNLISHINPLFTNNNFHFDVIDLNGNISIDKLINKINKMIYYYDLITTFVDFYGTKNIHEISKQCNNKKEKLDSFKQAIFSRLNKSNEQKKVLPYVQLHEIESLLFLRLDILNSYLIQFTDKKNKKIKKPKEDDFEEINNSPTTAPSKRITNVFPQYSSVKPTHFLEMIEKIGIDELLAKSSNFKDWLIEITKKIFQLK